MASSLNDDHDDGDSNMGLELVDSNSTPEPMSIDTDNHDNGGLGEESGSTYCQLCNKSFPSSRMLSQHNQSMHMDKSFVDKVGYGLTYL